MYVCLCNGITERQVRSHVECCGGSTVSSVHKALGMAPKCGKCIPMMRDMVRENTTPSASSI